MSLDSSAQDTTRASVSTKIFLIVAIFSLPIGVLAYLLASNYTPQIETAQLEIDGNALQRPLMKALSAELVAQNIVEGCGSGACATELTAQSAAIRSALDEAFTVNNGLSGALKTTNEDLAKKNHSDVTFDNMRSELSSLAISPANLASPESREKLATAYNRLADQSKDFIAYQGNTSNLILDPDLDSYYLVDVTLLAMPDAVTHIRNASAIAHKLTSGAGGPVEVAALLNETSLLEQTVSRIEASNNTSYDADADNHGVSPTLRPHLSAAFQAYKTQVGGFVQTLHVVAANPTQIQTTELATQSAAAQKATLAYWNVGVNELDTLLNMRIGDFENNRMEALGFSALAVLIATIVAYVIGRSITKPLEELVRNLGPGATLLGASVERIAHASQSQATNPMESAIICEELNAHADNMRLAVLELARHVQGSNATYQHGGAPSEAGADRS